MNRHNKKFNTKSCKSRTLWNLIKEVVYNRKVKLHYDNDPMYIS